MPNRILYSSLLKSRKYSSISPVVRDLYVRLILLADDYGRFDADAVIIARAAYPIDEGVSSKKIDPLLMDLHNSGLITVYTVGREKYLQIANWTQRTRQMSSKYPSADSCQSYDGQLTDTCPSCAHGDGDGDGKTQPTSRKTVKSKKEHYAEYVTLTGAEYSKLVERFGQEKTDGCITILDNYKGSVGKKYDSDYRAVLNWVVKRYDDDNGKSTASNQPYYKEL